MGCMYENVLLISWIGWYTYYIYLKIREICEGYAWKVAFYLSAFYIWIFFEHEREFVCYTLTFCVCVMSLMHWHRKIASCLIKRQVKKFIHLSFSCTFDGYSNDVGRLRLFKNNNNDNLCVFVLFLIVRL